MVIVIDKTILGMLIVMISRGGLVSAQVDLHWHVWIGIAIVVGIDHVDFHCNQNSYPGTLSLVTPP